MNLPVLILACKKSCFNQEQDLTLINQQPGLPQFFKIRCNCLAVLKPHWEAIYSIV
ncbi:MAG: hypothetical protein JWR61_1569 [Ferruginibacter sp.]|nr:hypothetical protein [Ferruginibacter sp.]